jgi:hypothetical protein
VGCALPTAVMPSFLLRLWVLVIGRENKRRGSDDTRGETEGESEMGRTNRKGDDNSDDTSNNDDRNGTRTQDSSTPGHLWLPAVLVDQVFYYDPKP